MNKKSTLILLSSAVVLILIVGSIGIVMANNTENYSTDDLDGKGYRFFQKHRRFLFRILKNKCNELALKFESIKTELLALRSEVKALMDAGVSREEIWELISTKLEELGIETPMCNDLTFLLSSLTDEQREALRLKLGEMRDAGASREEIKAELINMLQEWDIEVPKFPCLLRQRLRNRRRLRRKICVEPR